jgi:hypothetical protein
MLSEKYMIRKLNFYWLQWLPNLHRGTFVETLKCHRDQIVQLCWAEALKTNTPSIFNDLIAEISFNGFARAIHSTKPDPYERRIAPDDIVQAIKKMALIRGGEFDRGAITVEMVEDAGHIKSRLLNFFQDTFQEVEVNPRLKGFGRLASCYPDVIIADRLIEVKSSKYRFRVEDFKQVFLYYFLAFHNGRTIKDLELVNPRRGESIIINVDDFCRIFAQSSHSRTMDRLARDLM